MLGYGSAIGRTAHPRLGTRRGQKPSATRKGRRRATRTSEVRPREADPELTGAPVRGATYDSAEVDADVASAFEFGPDRGAPNGPTEDHAGLVVALLPFAAACGSSVKKAAKMPASAVPSRESARPYPALQPTPLRVEDPVLTLIAESEQHFEAGQRELEFGHVERARNRNSTAR